MSGALAATFLTFGVVAFAWAAMIWKKRKEHKKWVPFLMVIAGLMLGIGAGYLANVNVIQDKIGYVPVWVPFILIVGFGFLLEIRGWKGHPTRTPVLGFVTAFTLMLAAGQAVVSATTHEVHNVQVTSRFTQTGGSQGKKG
jgi:MFS family permease